MTFPNGPAITPDGRTLVVAESRGFRLTAFDIEENGDLTNRRLWADVGVPPDGICMNAEGCLGVAVIYHAFGGPGSFVRIKEGGDVLDRIDVEVSVGGDVSHDGRNAGGVRGDPNHRVGNCRHSRAPEQPRVDAGASVRPRRPLAPFPRQRKSGAVVSRLATATEGHNIDLFHIASFCSHYPIALLVLWWVGSWWLAIVAALSAQLIWRLVIWHSGIGWESWWARVWRKL